MSKATVFSQSRCVVFQKPLTRIEVEGLLKRFMSAVGIPLAYKGIILGHIKVLARIRTKDDFLFLSLTRLDHVDSKVSTQWSSEQCADIETMELDINVLVFGHSISVVEKVVDSSLQELRTGS